MLIDRYYETFNNLIEQVKSTQRENCIKAGEIVAKAAANGNAIHVFDSGHIINAELIERGGGLLMYKAFKYKLEVTSLVRERDRTEIDTQMDGLANYALRASGALPGDVMFIGSVSGKTVDVVDLAIEAKKFGLTVICLTSVEYSKGVESYHKSGKRLFECADLVIDNCAPIGEGLLEVEGLPAKLCAASGLAAAFIMWSVTTVAVEKLLEMGITPSVYKSYNLPGGEDHNAQAKQNYIDFGY